MKMKYLFKSPAIIVFFLLQPTPPSDTLAAVKAETTVVKLQNRHLICTIQVCEGQLISERLQSTATHSKPLIQLQTDANFALDIMWSDWRAPGKRNNADNPVLLQKKDFVYFGQEKRHLIGDGEETTLFFRGAGHPILLKMVYQLPQNSSYIRRKVAVCDTTFGHHFLRWFWPRYGTIADVSSIVKAGDFGQPVAVLLKQGGAFFGVEYPAAENRLDSSGLLRCGHEYGQLIGREWIESEWVVCGLSADEHVKLAFMRYLDDIRVVPLKPYTLYNSWYDLRSPEYPRVPPENVMSEQSALKMIDLLRVNMVEKHGIHLDAFVLDDGWDIYKSDWALRPEQFPNGLKPLTAALQKMGTHLGIWIGPTGGYSFRKWRLEWMREKGYETVGDQLCVAGKKYRALLQKRIADFARKDGVNYFKWDGIQFSCSELDHGHPVDIYSRRAVLQSVIELCRIAREKNPTMFLNITSGTWLSPWWVQYANTIWMDGEDYGYADVPSISQRDGAITYRDFVLYEDFKIKDLWFPIANLMTHGIIKGKLELLGSPEEPLDKFTDDVLLYFARGVAMYELYISPDILTEGEWDAIGRSIAWAKDRFPILRQTEMIGGNPMQREPYGYVHFKGDRGIIAARNPFIEDNNLEVQLTAAHGLNTDAHELVLERIYPTRWIAPQLFKCGDRIELPLAGYETAVYELYPLKAANKPLLAGVTFEGIGQKGDEWQVLCYGGGEGRLLNPSLVRGVRVDERNVSLRDFRLSMQTAPPMVSNTMVGRIDQGDTIDFIIPYTLDTTCREGQLALLLTPQEKLDRKQVQVVARLDGREVPVRAEYQEGRSQWYTLPVPSDEHEVQVFIHGAKGVKGEIQLWMIAQQPQPAEIVTIKVKTKPESEILPPRIWPRGSLRTSVRLGTLKLE